MSSFISTFVSEPSSFFISELTGDQHTLELVGRALPYKPFTLEGTMRAEFTYYPGNPVATVQMLGSKEEPSTINGMWKDRFIRSFDDLGVPVIEGKTGIAYFDGTPVADVRALVRVADEFRRRGQLLEVIWDDVVRQGILTKFKATWQRREDVEWEMEFTWISQGDPVLPVAFGIDIPQLDLANQILAALDALKAIITAPFAIVTAVSNAVNDAVSTIETAVNDLGTIATKAEQAVTAPIDAARNTIATFQTIKNEAKKIEDQLETLPARALRSVVSLADVDQGEALEAEAYKRSVRKQARALRALAAQRQQELEAKTVLQPNVATFVARAGQDLRSVSTQFYGNPNEWRRLATYNKLHSSRLTAGMVIIVPPLNTASGRG